VRPSLFKVISIQTMPPRYTYYCVGKHECTTMDKALVDRGANGGICGEDMK
jgi:hypothetical protein